MTTNQPDAPNDFETTVLSELRQINQRLDHLETDVSNLQLKLEKVDYKFDTYQKASDSMVRLATTIIVAAATVAVLPSALSAISPLINALITGVGSGSQSLFNFAAVRKICPAKIAAPKPLSILTTPTPAAQELSIVNKGASPPKLAP